MSAFTLTRILNTVDPGLAKRTYLFGRRDLLTRADGELSLVSAKWDNMLDAGNFKKSPAFTLGLIATSAAEFGNRKLVDEALQLADKYMERLDDPAVLAYRKASVAGNANLACARFAQKDDFYHMLHKGPGEGALRGPLLVECRYPEVLVARAMSDGDDLDLVLYNGAQPEKQTLGFERLQPGRKYEVKGTADSFRSDEQGHAWLDVHLNGRTQVHIVPAE